MNAPIPRIAPHERIAREAPAIWLRRLWERMVAMYGHAWTNVHGVTPHGGDGGLSMSGDTWSRVLSGLEARQIAEGIETCIAQGAEFPPSAPHFRAMCLGIPALAAVQREMGEVERSPFTRAVWARLDSYRFRQVTAAAAERMLRDAYALVRDEVMRGVALPITPAAAVEHVKPATTPATQEQASAHMATIAALLNGGVA